MSPRSVDPAPRIRAVDSHAHFWDPARLNYPWLDTMPSLSHAFLPQDYAPVKSADVGSVIFVEANCSPSQAAHEVAFVQHLRESFSWIVGIVAFVDLLHESTRDSRLDELAKSRGVTGVRHNVQGQPPGFCLQPAFERGVREVGEKGFVFDLCATADQLDDVRHLVERCPSTEFVLDHCGKPAVARAGMAGWSASIERLSKLPNVSCKVSGLFSEARPDQRTPDALGPYIAWVRDCFGLSRLMYGSDWPLVEEAGGGSTWRDVIEACTASWSSAARDAFFVHNALGIYRIDRRVIRTAS